MFSYKFIIRYNGYNYSGLQSQINARTIQDELHKSLVQLCKIKDKKKIKSSWSGRTDGGVHAREQYGRVDLEKNIKCEVLKKGLNKILSLDIRILSVSTCSENYVPRKLATKKEYRYYFTMESNAPFGYELVTFYPKHLDLDKIRKGLKLLKGEHDFKNFYNTGTSFGSSVRKIESASLVKMDDHPLLPQGVYYISLVSNGFLKQMARIIIGHLFEIGSGKISIENFKKALDGPKLSHKLAKSAPASGLMLHKIWFE